VRGLSLPNNFVNELILAENLVEHDFDVMAGVPITVVVEAAGFDGRIDTNCDILLCCDGCDFGAAIVEDGRDVGGPNQS